MQTLYDFMRRYRREDGSELCDTFIRAPKRRTDPAYYEVVSDPVTKLFHPSTNFCFNKLNPYTYTVKSR
jgi:hypothetical protein